MLWGFGGFSWGFFGFFFFFFGGGGGIVVVFMGGVVLFFLSGFGFSFFFDDIGLVFKEFSYKTAKIN